MGAVFGEGEHESSRVEELKFLSKCSTDAPKNIFAREERDRNILITGKE